jgi:hypothetical protein
MLFILRRIAIDEIVALFHKPFNLSVFMLSMTRDELHGQQGNHAENGPDDKRYAVINHP